MTAGAEPEGTGRWRVDDLWVHSFHSVVVLERAGAERPNVTVAELCELVRCES